MFFSKHTWKGSPIILECTWLGRFFLFFFAVHPIRFCTSVCLTLSSHCRIFGFSGMFQYTGVLYQCSCIDNACSHDNHASLSLAVHILCKYVLPFLIFNPFPIFVYAVMQFLAFWHFSPLHFVLWPFAHFAAFRFFVPLWHCYTFNVAAPVTIYCAKPCCFILLFLQFPCFNDSSGNVLK